MEDEYKDISPLYMQRLKGRVENALWNLFAGSKYRQVEEYVRRWHDDGGSIWENFCIFEKDGRIDLSRTLAGMPNDILIKMAADIGVETPGLLPSIPVMKNILNQNNTNVYMNFERAVKDVYEHPDRSVALAASTLEGVFKTILQNSDPDIQAKNPSLSELTVKAVKQLIGECDASAPREIRTLASQLRGLGSTIDDLRSDKSTAHGKAAGDYVIDDELWAEAVVNATATLGLLLWRLHERSCAEAKVTSTDQSIPTYDDDIPF